MAGSGNGPLGLLFMIAPLAAIPVFVYIDIPQLPFLAASQRTENSVEWDDADSFTDSGVEDSRPEPAPRRVSVTTTDSPDPPAPRRDHGPAAAGDKGVNSPRNDPPRRWLPPAEALDQWQESKPTSERPRPSDSDSAAPGDGLEGGLPDNFDAGAFDTLSPTETDPATERDANSRSGRKSLSRPAAPPEGQSGKLSAGRVPQGGPARPGLPGPGSEHAGWSMLSQRLKELGVRQYRLVSHVDDGTFTFIASLPATDNPQVEHRFEADGETPLEAVQAALQQIEKWRKRPPRADEGDASDDVGQ